MRSIAVLSTKRSGHHAFIESFLEGESFFYENNLVLKGGELVPAVVLEEGREASLYVASLERNYVPER